MAGNLAISQINSGQIGYRNVIINARVSINQRGVTFASASVGDYWADRWKKTSGSTMTQIIEDGNYVSGATYTLSGVNVTTQQLTAPTSGNWTLPDIPSNAYNVQLEKGTEATYFEIVPYGIDYINCLRYFQSIDNDWRNDMTLGGAAISAGYMAHFYTKMRITPTVTVTAQSGTSSTNVTGITVKGPDGVRVEWDWLGDVATVRTKAYILFCDAEL